MPKSASMKYYYVTDNFVLPTGTVDVILYVNAMAGGLLKDITITLPTPKVDDKRQVIINTAYGLTHDHKIMIVEPEGGIAPMKFGEQRIFRIAQDGLVTTEPPYWIEVLSIKPAPKVITDA